jgi:hypothetical protein
MDDTGSKGVRRSEHRDKRMIRRPGSKVAVVQDGIHNKDERTRDDGIAGPTEMRPAARNPDAVAAAGGEKP